MKNQHLRREAENPHEEIERLRAMLSVREVLLHARYDAEKSEIASLKRRLSQRDARLRAQQAILREQTLYLAGSLILLGVMVIAAWV
jgi:hypothetical protein